jgi:polyhydroxybutyrate depolymerase
MATAPNTCFCRSLRSENPIRMRNRYFLLTALMACASLCNAQGIIDASIMHDGLTRTYRLYVPASYSASVPVPLVLNLHGYTSNNVQQEFYGDFRPIADTANFIIVHPNGTLDGSNQQFWSAFGLSTVDDVGFLSALIDEIQSQYAIDPNCIYSTGMSNGGFMSYELACQLSGRIAAIASVTGSMIQSRFNACNAYHPTPVMQIHGTADPTVPYIGNPAQGMMHIDTLVKRWAQYNNCDLTPSVTPVPNTNLMDGCTAEHQVFANGDQGATVELFKVIGGAHTWPGASITIGVTNQDFNASVEIWKFFRRYKLNDLLTGVSHHDAADHQFFIYPNPSEGTVNLHFPDQGPRTISVINSSGQVIMTDRQSGHSGMLIIPKAGLYLILSEEDDGLRKVQRILVQ